MEKLEANNIAGNEFNMKNNANYSYKFMEDFNFLNLKTKFFKVWQYTGNLIHFANFLHFWHASCLKKYDIKDIRL